MASLGSSAERYLDYLTAEGARAFQQRRGTTSRGRVFGASLLFFEGEPFLGHDWIALLKRGFATANQLRSRHQLSAGRVEYSRFKAKSKRSEALVRFDIARRRSESSPRWPQRGKA